MHGISIVRSRLPRLLAAAAFIAGALPLAGCLHLLWKVPDPADEVRYATTSDGWKIALHHHRPRPAAARDSGASAPSAPRLPVVVCHGIDANSRSWDLDADHSLPVFLAARGYDVWAVDLRGVGLSDRRDYHFDFDDYVRQDVPAVLAFVLKETGAPAVHWVGHSMGGMVMYAYLETQDPTPVRDVTAVGSPALFADFNDPFWAALPYRKLANRVDVFQAEVLADLAAPWEWTARWTPFGVLAWNPDNLSGTTIRKMMINSAGNVSTRVINQMALRGARIPRRIEVTSRDGSINYTRALSRIHTPFLFVAGSVDNLGTPYAVRYAYEHVASTDKEWRLFTRANGDSGEYGHVDLVLGEKAREEVYPVLLQWIERHEARP